MKLIAQVKLQPTPEQAEALRQTILTYCAAANYISEQAWMRKTFRAYDLHHATYYPVREKFGLTAQLTIRVIKDVADAYKLDTKTKRVFWRMGSVTYDSRVLRWMLGKSAVSIWTMGGRQTIPFACGDRQRKMLETLQGEADLICRDGEFYLHQPCNILEDDSFNPDDWLGVDLGIVNIATTSDGVVFTGKEVLAVRKRRRRQRKRLQSKTTSSARRVLRRLSGREARFARDVNHCVSKKIVEEAKRTGRGIALEDLTGIRGRVRLRRSQRDNLHSWSFYQLRQFTTYKAQLHGVPVVAVDPRHTSQGCSSCGHVAKANRKTQDRFLCVACGFRCNADHNAAMNIRGRAAVRQPDVSGESTQFVLAAQEQAPQL